MLILLRQLHCSSLELDANPDYPFSQNLENHKMLGRMRNVSGSLPRYIRFSAVCAQLVCDHELVSGEHLMPS